MKTHQIQLTLTFTKSKYVSKYPITRDLLHFLEMEKWNVSVWTVGTSPSARWGPSCGGALVPNSAHSWMSGCSDPLIPSATSFNTQPWCNVATWSGCTRRNEKKKESPQTVECLRMRGRNIYHRCLHFAARCLIAAAQCVWLHFLLSWSGLIRAHPPRPWIRSGPDPSPPRSVSVSRLESGRDSYGAETAATDVRCTVHLLGLNAARLPVALEEGSGEEGDPQLLLLGIDK